ncbi:Fur-regulated basic protein FbpA [Niallia sp. 03133]|uniref:Fur-regulated basic protein FbpA n=1 Tax=Niallia sp. 03133 TaxID=3458060 RepID=UPI004044CC1E
MEKQSTTITDNEKDVLIEKLIENGIFKKESFHLFELSVVELKEEYEKVLHVSNRK